MIKRLLSLFERQEVAVDDDQFEMPTATQKGDLDQHSPTWAAIEHWAVAELQKAREDNDSSARDAAQTAALRGRIKLLKEILELPLPPKRDRQRPPRPSEDTDY